jgi:uncharacterized protein (DUF58 family)
VTQPTPRALWLAAAGLGVSLLPALVNARLWTLWAAAAALTLLAIGLDAALAVRPRELSIGAKAPATLAIGEEGLLEVTLSSPRGPGRVEVLCELDEQFAPQPPAAAVVRAREPATLAFTLLGRKRGQLTVDNVWCRWEGPLGLVRRQQRQPVDATVAVVPDVRPVRAAAFRYFSQRETQLGVQVERYVGSGSEFDALREYVPGLDHRAIDWKASARHRKLLSQDFRAERNHQVVLALDTGHLMSEPLSGISRLDHALTSALLLAYVSLKLGDRVGLYGFDQKAQAWSEPAGGLGAFARLQHVSAGLQASPAETNFTLGLTELSVRLRRRSLVVVFTDFVDTVTAELMVDNLARLARRQLVVFVALRDPALAAIAGAPPRQLKDLYRATVAADFERERERVLVRLRRLGILCVDAAPGEVSTRLVNRYLDVKRRELV